MSGFPTNIQVIKPTRTRPRAGDLFAIRLPDETHLFGRVVDAEITDPHRAPMPGAYLIYVYDVRAAAMEVDPADLTSDRVLLPPVFINKMPWTKGYFFTIGHRELDDRDRLPVVSFWDSARSEFRDEQGRSIGHEVQPCIAAALSAAPVPGTASPVLSVAVPACPGRNADRSSGGPVRGHLASNAPGARIVTT